MWLLKIVQSIAKSVWKMDDLIMGKIHWPPTNHQTHALTDRQTDPAHTHTHTQFILKPYIASKILTNQNALCFQKFLKSPD